MNISVKIGDIQKAVAKECQYLEDTSKDNINSITRLYIKQLKKDGYTIGEHCQTFDSNAKRVNFFIDHED